MTLALIGGAVAVAAVLAVLDSSGAIPIAMLAIVEEGGAS